MYDTSDFGTYRAAYLALLADSGLREPNKGEIRVINAVNNCSASAEMRETYDFLRTKFLWCVKTSLADTITPDGIQLRNVSHFSNGDVIVNSL